MSEYDTDQRVSKLREALEQKQSELQIYVNHKRLQDHEVHQLHQKIAVLEERVAEMSTLSSEVASENQKLKLKCDSLSQFNQELEQIKLIGVKDDDAFEMMKQISAFKQGGVEAAIQVMNEEADLKLIMGWISTKVAKRTLLAVVFVVLVQFELKISSLG